MDAPGLLAGDFPPTTYEQWRRRVEAELGGAPFATLASDAPGAVDRRPLYTAGDLDGDDPAGFPGQAPRTRGGHAARRGWTAAQEYRASDDDAGLAADLAAGVELVILPGDALERFLPHLDLGRTAVVVKDGAAALTAAGAVAAAAARQGVAAGGLRGGFGCDPLGALAGRGELPGSLDRAFDLAADLLAWSRRETPNVRPLLVDVAPYHAAGAGAVEELAAAAASGVELLRRLTAAGHDVDAVAGATLFGFSVGGDVFLEIAKLRAARLVWAKVVKASGGSPGAQRMWLHAGSSSVTRTLRDPWVNLLRGTTESFAAIVGGADSIATAPFNELLGSPGRTSRRLAVNAQHILREEAFLGEVLDPAGGSYYVESLTEELARAAWSLLQEIERRGGMARALGWVRERIAATAAARREAAARRQPPIVGVSDYAHLEEELPLPAPPRPPAEKPAGRPPEARLAELARDLDEPAGDGSATAAVVAAAIAGVARHDLEAILWRGSEPARAPALPRFRPAEPFEELRALSGRWRDARGRRPRVFLVELGEPSQHRARAGFAASFFAAGGIEAADSGSLPVDGDLPSAAAAAFAASAADLAVLCSADELYPEAVPLLAPVLKARGARAVILAGRPGEHEASYRAAGVDGFIYLGVDAVAALRAVWAVIEA